MKPISLNLKIFLLTLSILFLALLLQTAIIQIVMERQIVKDGGEKVRATASLISEDPRLIEAFGEEDPSRILQPLTLGMQRRTDVSFIVVINRDSLRYSHPDPKRIGRHFVGGDELAALKGKSYTSIAQGTLGTSIRAFEPVRSRNGEIIGVVVVGVLLENLKEIQLVINRILYLVAAVGTIIVVLGALLLARHVKKSIYGLEPEEIANLLTQHNTITASIREGILAIDTEGKIILINEQACRILRISGDPMGKAVLSVIPQSRLPDVIASEKALLDSELVINNIHIMANRIPLFHQGRLIGAVATFRDMSEIQNLAEELTEVRSYINALRAQHHEHLNHLQVISGMMQLGKQREAVEFINSITEYQQEISDFILENIRDPGLSGLILAKIRDAEEKGIEVILNPDTEIPTLEKGALNDIVSIMGNLIQNAIDEAPTRIDIFLVMTDRELYMEVGDNGGGIHAGPDVDIFQEGISTKGSSRKRGMGLSLVKKLTEKRCGTVEYESSGGGCLFRVRLPAAGLKANTG